MRIAIHILFVIKKNLQSQISQLFGHVLCLGLVCLGLAISAQPNYRSDPYFNATFPTSTPGANGAWEIEDFLPDIRIASPLKIIDVPGENSIFILGKLGEIWKVDLTTKTQRLVLDIKDRCMDHGEAGAVGLTVHPKFNIDPLNKTLFIYYRYTHDGKTYNQGHNRLSKFTWDNDLNIFSLNSEEVLFQQYDRHPWHNGGALFFDNDGYLYISVGDEGKSSEFDITLSTQRIDNGFFGGVLRIDVDNDMSRSHPIRRQPKELTPRDPAFEPTYSKGYSVPNDNPWQSESGDVLEEFYAIGLRAPYSAFYDARENQIWVSDVGSIKLEEINLITKGSNYQWPYAEGDLVSDDYPKPNPVLGTEQQPYYFYNRDFGSAIVGGAIYRGLDFPSLDEKFVFGDYTKRSVMVIDKDTEDDPTVLIENVRQEMLSKGIPLPAKAGVAGISILKDGTVLITVISGELFANTGRILQLTNKEVVDDPAILLSQLGVFKNMQSREIADGFIPYEVNSPLWSDRAIKSRWVSIPNDGNFNQPSEKIKFSAFTEWEFPEGTVFVKHFELPIDLNNATNVVPLETRFFIIGEGGIGYGLTYKWNEEGTEAFLQQSKTVEEYKITDDGSFAYNQIWDYPSRSNCMSCHNANAGFVLGLNTHQLNREIVQPGTSMQVNQLGYFNDLGLFDKNIGNPKAYLRSYHLESQEASLDVRVRSYLDANCAFCHRTNGVVSTSNMDLRFQQPVNAQFIIKLPTESVASTQEFIVQPGDHSRSEIWLRDATRNTNQMPPLASNLVHQTYVDSLAKWIDRLKDEPLERTAINMGPNPTTDFIRIDIGEAWLPDFLLTITDMNGVRRLVSTFENEINLIDLSEFEAGVYIFKIESGELTRIEKVVIL